MNMLMANLLFPEVWVRLAEATQEALLSAQVDGVAIMLLILAVLLRLAFQNLEIIILLHLKLLQQLRFIKVVMSEEQFIAMAPSRLDGMLVPLMQAGH